MTGTCGSKIAQVTCVRGIEATWLEELECLAACLYVIDANKGQFTRLKIKRIASPYAYEAWNES